MRWRSVVVAAACVACLGVLASGQTPPRDVTSPRPGSSRLLGRVLRSDTGAPVRRALVLVYGAEIPDGRPILTESDGRYDSGVLPAGTYHVTVTKQGLLNAEFGATVPGQPGRAVVVRDGEKLENLIIYMCRGGSISGRILDEYGEPVASATVRALREQTVGGIRRLVSTGSMAFPHTDDLGQYRIFGLVPGRYYVAASSPDENGSPVPAAQQTDYAPTYYPGTASISSARALQIGPAEDQTGIDVGLTVIRTARASGICLGPRGQRLTGGSVGALLITDGAEVPGTTATAGISADGTFVLEKLAPGDYWLMVTAIGNERGTAVADRSVVFGFTRLTISGTDVAGITLQATEGSTLTGQIVFDGAARARDAAARVSVSVNPIESPEAPAVGGAFNLGMMRARQVLDDGTFTLAGLFGQWFLDVSPPPGWMLKAIYNRGRDVTDAPFTCDGREAIAGVQVVLTDRVTHVIASVTGAGGALPPNAQVFVVADDPARWHPGYGSRYIRHMYCEDGSDATFDGLMPGDYFAVAISGDRDSGDILEPSMLERLRASGLRFTLEAGETRRLAVKLTGIQ